MITFLKNTFKAYSYAIGSLMLISVTYNLLEKYYFVEDIADRKEMEELEDEESN